MVSNFRSVLENRYHLDLTSVNRALASFNYKLDDDRTRKQTICNRLIKDLGCNPINHPVDAETYAKTLIEQVILNGEDYDPAKAAINAAARVEKIKKQMPELYAGIEIAVVGETPEETTFQRKKKVKRAGRDSGDKKDNAYKIYMQHKEKPAGDIAKLIAAELKITYANAYYYVSRVFKNRS
jgi:hypothetical protein